MKTLSIIFWRFLKALPLVLFFPILLFVAAVALALTDLISAFVRKSMPADQRPDARSATVVIPNWNGRDLLQKYIPSIIEALAGNSENEILVVDNGSDDGSAEFLRETFPSVHVLALERNLGFGGGSNAGFRAAKNDIVVLLNSDMRVEPNFLAPLLDGFIDASVFSVACQIFFSDPKKLREETGLTQFWWENGAIRVRHRDDAAIQVLYPCAYGGGGSCAFDRKKFLELGGFDELFAPFYMEDTDVGYRAWKRGWKVLYQPRSVVYHEHRGTIGKRFSKAYIDSVLKKNFALFSWKNIHEWSRLGPHFFFAYAGAVVTELFGESPERANFGGLWCAFRELPQAMRSRARARKQAAIGDTEALRRPLGGYYRDRFAPVEQAEKLSVLFVSPYPICPPIHGGGVFMYQTVRELTRMCELHLVIQLDHAWQREEHQDLEREVASIAYVVRSEPSEKQFGSILPHAISEFRSQELEWAIQREIYLRQVDVVQLEYTALSQYWGDYRRLGCMLFEHDIYFQSIGRGTHATGMVKSAKAAYEYLRSLRYELRVLPRFDRVQVCSPANRDYLLSFLPALQGRTDDNRAGIDTSRYDFHGTFNGNSREPDTMLFLGSFRHTPNQQGLIWFTRNVLPAVLRSKPHARLVIVGSDAPPRHSLPHLPDNIELRGFVDDVREPLGRYAVFVCPILTGSGMRVKLLEAFAAGIPVVSTTLGAEGLAENDGEICALADDPSEFAGKILQLLDDPERAQKMACRAREHVVATRDMRVLTENLVLTYREVVNEKRMR